jgi:thiol-disulfide isomerase/thioredoxin
VNRILLATIVAAPLLLAGGGGSDAVTPAASSAPVAVPETTPGTASPPAAVPDSLRFTARTVAGAPFSWSSLAGHSALLWFWAPGCSDCERLAPGVLAAAKASPGVSFVGIAGLSGPAAMREAAAAMHIDSLT